jgi:hypothetical protein
VRHLWILAAVGWTGCASPLHMTYDFGRAYTVAFTMQADLSRPSVANSQYPLYGTEAEAIRIQVQEKTSDEEAQESTMNLGVGG